MANRMTPFGYEFVDGKLAIAVDEARIVKTVFNKYVGGSSLKDIANNLTLQGVEFHTNKSNWDKIRISRMLENYKYIGEDSYPLIIEHELFEKAQNKKNSKKIKMVESVCGIEPLRHLIYCKQCGKAFRRIGKWKTREKWLCPSGCESKYYIDDKVIVQEIVNIAKCVTADNGLITPISNSVNYKKTPEIMRYTHEITRLINDVKTSFAVGKNAILKTATLKFDACNEVQSIKTIQIIEQLEVVASDGNLASIDIKELIDYVEFDAEGNMSIMFSNGVSIKNN